METKRAYTVLLAESDVLQRSTVAAYLRQCGYTVAEASDIHEAMALFTHSDLRINILFSDIDIPEAEDGFALAQWVRRNRPDINVILCGDVEKAAAAAGELCEKGPHLKKPYEPQQLVQWIKRQQSGPTPAKTAPTSRKRAPALDELVIA